MAITAVAVAVAVAGCALAPAAPAATDADFAAIVPGTTRAAVEARFGPPTWTFRVRQEDLTILNYRFDRTHCVIYQISVRSDQTVKDAAPGQDPACDPPP